MSEISHQQADHIHRGAFAFCPHCGSPVAQRERSLSGKDICERGHRYPAHLSLKLGQFKPKG